MERILPEGMDIGISWLYPTVEAMFEKEQLWRSLNLTILEICRHVLSALDQPNPDENLIHTVSMMWRLKF